jgi:hypothetical protein
MGLACFDQMKRAFRCEAGETLMSLHLIASGLGWGGGRSDANRIVTAS